jgi:cytochrome c nitrite reductase small subunit
MASIREKSRDFFTLSSVRKTLLVIITAIGAGLVFTILVLSNAVSYLSDDPSACVNCHIMTPQYATWFHSSHRERAICNDCHVPHDNFIREYFYHASDGTRHSFLFTFRLDRQVITINEASKAVVQENCIRCHINLVNPISARNVTGHNYKLGQGKLCWECHREVPHGREHSQASTPYAHVPSLKPVIPGWLKSVIENKNR